MMRQKIKIAALELFSENGFRGTTIKDIAMASGLKPSSIYSHYESKDELFSEVWKECMKRINIAIADLAIKISQDNDFEEEEVLKEFFLRLIDYYSKHKQEYLFTKNTMLEHSLRKSIPENTYIDFNKVSCYFGLAFDKLKSKKIICDIDNEKLTSMYITIMLGYLEQSILFGFQLERLDLEKIWIVFWSGLVNEK